MRQKDLLYLQRTVVASFLIQIFLEIIFVSFALFGNAYQLFQLSYWNLATILLWASAIIDLSLQRKVLIHQNIDDTDESSNLFDEKYEDLLLKRQIHVFYHRISVLFVSLTCVALCFYAYSLWKPLHNLNVSKISWQTQATMWLCRAVISFIMAKYLIGLSLPARQGYVACLGGLNIIQAFLSLLFSIAVFGGVQSYTFFDNYFYYIPTLIVVVYVFEIVFRALSKWYDSSSDRLPPQCSSIIYLTGQKSWKEELDKGMTYQFGYDLKYFLQHQCLKNLSFLLFLMMLISCLFTSVGVLSNGEVAFIETFGKRNETPITAGLYLKYPWPISKIRKVDVHFVHRLEIGHSKEVDSMIWSEHGEEENQFLVRDQDWVQKELPFEIYAVNAVLAYQVKDPYAYLYHHEHPRNVILNSVHHQLCSHFFKTNRSVLFRIQKGSFEKKIAEDLQARLKELNLGVEILYFSIPQIHPPGSTIEAFESAIGAKVQKKQQLLEAEAERLRLKAEVEGSLYLKLQEAKSKAVQIKSESLADQNYVHYLAPLYQKVGPLLIQRKVLEEFPEHLKSMRKIFVLHDPKKKVYTLNLEKPLDPELLDLSLQARE